MIMAPWGATVVLRDIAFRPATLHVSPGATVTFAWRDGDIPHNVVAVGRPRFPWLAARKSGTARVRFAHAGSYRYVSTIIPEWPGA
jgi:plastocyanin